ncbi:MAG: hypothetical protein ACRD2O_13880, partial [Terriglobia bacterium]
MSRSISGTNDVAARPDSVRGKFPAKPLRWRGKFDKVVELRGERPGPFSCGCALCSPEADTASA